MVSATTPLAATTRSALDEVSAMVASSYANNSKLYAFLGERATLGEIVDFLLWDSAQPPFNVYLRHWLDKVPATIHAALVEHIRVEEDEEHSRLFREMMEHLAGACPRTPAVDQAQLDELNYTFSAQCAAEQDAAFFVGGFYATEIMSARRCRLIYDGLRRLGLSDLGEPRRGVDARDAGPRRGGLHRMAYLELHADADAGHGIEVMELMVAPIAHADPSALAGIRRGVVDRLERSGRYLRWYERNRLSL